MLNAPWNFVLQDRWFNLGSRWGSTVKCYRRLQFVADQEDKKAGQLLWAGKCIDAKLQEGCQTTIWLADIAVLSSKNGLNLVLAGQQFVLQERGKGAPSKKPDTVRGQLFAICYYNCITITRCKVVKYLLTMGI